jgi:hypothetical protein
MQIKNGNELDLAGSHGETITVAITGGGSNVVINYVLNGLTWPGGPFQLDRNVAAVFKLLVQSIYKTQTGGNCEITVTGSQGGDTSVHDEFQSPGESFDAAMYTFIVQ